MSFILKIVEGPNKGAEIALVEGVAVTLGRGDDCDIVLADSTMPDAPLVLETTADGVVAGGERLEPLHVKTLGATSFAVGPADAPWGSLVWPKDESGEQGTGNREQGTGNGGSSDVSSPSTKDESASEGSPPDQPDKKKRGCGCGCFLAMLALLMILAALAWLFRERLDETGYFDGIKNSRWVKKVVAVSRDGCARTSELVATWKAEDAQSPAAKPPMTLQDVAEKYELSLSDTNGVARVSGNLKTRRDRLAATAEAYAVRPGAELDLSDDESFRTSAEDALFALTEGALKVSVATNRAMSIVGHARSAEALKRTLRALNADIPRLRAVDVAGVSFSSEVAEPQIAAAVGGLSPAGPMVHRPSKASKTGFQPLPVCGILTTPYPCLITRDGRRYLEGAEIGGSVIVGIGADSVVLTNSMGRFTWKP